MIVLDVDATGRAVLFVLLVIVIWAKTFIEKQENFHFIFFCAIIHLEVILCLKS